MKTQITNMIVALVATLTIAATANAQQQAVQMIQAPGQQQAYVMPPQTQNQFYFGMRLELANNGWGGTTLRVVDVTWGSPAQRAGLEVGDEIRTVNGRGFQGAYDSFDAVRKMNQFVSFGGGGGGAPAAAASSPAVAAYVIGPMPSPQPIARMIVRNVRNGQNVSVNVFPTRRGIIGTPAVAASTVAGG